MSTQILVLIELLLVFGGLLGWGAWEVWRWRRWRRDQQGATPSQPGGLPSQDVPPSP
jgi:hypothetical protein